MVDLNDNVLEFVNDNLDFNVFENFGCNVMVGVLLVYDSDSGENNWVLFFIDFCLKLGLLFEVFFNGLIIVMNSLDRENCFMYMFEVVVMDYGVLF